MPNNTYVINILITKDNMLGHQETLPTNASR